MIVAVVLALALTITACGTATDGNLANEALIYGGIVLPPSAKVLAVDYDKGLDLLYRLAIEIDAGSVDTLLSASTFTTPLAPGRKVFITPLEGFDPDNGTDIASAQDRLPPGGERRKTVAREILVDRTSAAKPVVHMWLFST